MQNKSNCNELKYFYKHIQLMLTNIMINFQKSKNSMFTIGNRQFDTLMDGNPIIVIFKH